MRMRIWLSALTLAGAFNASLLAQPLVWRKAERPIDPQPTVRASSGTTGIALDRPIVAASYEERSQAGAPRTLPDLYRRDSDTVASGQSYRIDRIPVYSPPGAIIAVSGPTPTPLPVNGMEQDDPYRAGDQFATDRGTIPSRSVARLSTGPQLVPVGTDLPEKVQVGNWIRTFPVAPPAPVSEAVFGEHGGRGDAAEPSRLYFKSEYLLWWTKTDKAPPLVTAGSATNEDFPRADGALGNPDTAVLQNGSLRRNPFSGGRFTVGYGLDDCGEKYLELTGFFLGERNYNFRATTAQNAVLSRPFFAINPERNQEFVQETGRTGFAVGSVSVRAPSQLWGMEPNMVCKWMEGCDYRVDVLAGGRYLNLRESLTIVEDIFQLPRTPGPFANVRYQITDRFATTNQFYGGQVGVRGNWRLDRFTLEGEAKLALGVTHETSTTDGFFTVPAGVVNPDPRRGGLLAEPSNIGSFSRDRFAVVPEVGIRLGYDLHDCVRLTVGYNFLYWSSVMRPGDQIDRNLDVTNIPNFTARDANNNPIVNPVTPARPAVLLKDTDYWAQGLTFGIEFRY